MNKSAVYEQLITTNEDEAAKKKDYKLKKKCERVNKRDSLFCFCAKSENTNSFSFPFSSPKAGLK